jgi:hypothetical protein
MDKFCSEFDWGLPDWIAQGEHSSADAIARFDNLDSESRASDLDRGRKSGCACAYHE